MSLMTDQLAATIDARQAAYQRAQAIAADLAHRIATGTLPEPRTVGVEAEEPNDVPEWDEGWALAEGRARDDIYGRNA